MLGGPETEAGLLMAIAPDCCVGMRHVCMQCDTDITRPTGDHLPTCQRPPLFPAFPGRRLAARRSSSSLVTTAGTTPSARPGAALRSVHRTTTLQWTPRPCLPVWRCHTSTSTTAHAQVCRLVCVHVDGCVWGDDDPRCDACWMRVCVCVCLGVCVVCLWCCLVHVCDSSPMR